MAEIIIMPKLGFNMSVGKLVKWYKSEGESVKKGEPMFSIETDKTSIDIEVTHDGVFRKKFIEEGDSIEVTLPIAIIADAEENIESLIIEANLQLKRENQAGDMQEIASPQQSAEDTPAFVSANKTKGKLKITPRARKLALEKGIFLDTIDIVGTGWQGGICEKDIAQVIATQGKIIASPLAKKMANSQGIDLRNIEGSGPDNKVMKRDLKNSRKAIQDQQDACISQDGKEILEEVPYSGIRKIIGDRLTQSKIDAPHVYFTQKVNLEKLLDVRKQINQYNEQKISVTDLIAMAVVNALKKYPDLNASLEHDKIIKYKTINLGIAVAAPSGLIVPSVKHADTMNVFEIAQTITTLVEKARNGKLIPQEYIGGTFTISNLGMFGIENFTAIINPPEVGILAVSSTKDEPVVINNSDGSKVIGIKPMMNITLSTDHRVVDGLLSAQFITEIKDMLENPISLII